MRKIVEREEESFRATLQRGVDMLSEIVDEKDVSGDDAFFLHDTLGFPIDLTREIAGERGRAVDLDGFEERMQEQRVRARADAAEAGAAHGRAARAVPRARRHARPDRVHRSPGVHVDREGARAARRRRARRPGRPRALEVDVVLDRTPFYAESGGQVGDTGHDHDRARRGRSTSPTRSTACPVRSRCTAARVRVGAVAEGDEVVAEIDGVRRDRIRRNHTATHVLHWALREVLGTHVQQAGSFVGPDRLRFDFSHHEPVTAEQLAQVERLANAQVISDAPVRHYETTKAEAERIGAIAFFGEKYGDIVRVLEAGPSTELCGGTHVHALGFIGPIKVVSESSIGSNLRRIEAMTGDGAFEYIEFEEQLLRRAGDLLRATPKEVPDRIERLSERGARAARTSSAACGRRRPPSAAGDLAGRAENGVARRPRRRPRFRRAEAARAGDRARARYRGGRARRRGRRQGRDRGRGQQGRRRARARPADAIAKPAVGKARRRRRARARKRWSAAGRTSAASTTRSRSPASWRRSGGRDGDDRNPRAGRRPRGTAHRARVVGSVPHGRVAATRCCGAAAIRSPIAARSSDARRAEGANVIVVGLPLSLSGRAGPAAQAALAEVEALHAVAGDIEVVVHDERLTTVTAERGAHRGAHAARRAPAASSTRSRRR